VHAKSTWIVERMGTDQTNSRINIHVVHFAFLPAVHAITPVLRTQMI
jgi:hypothetical protein